MRAVAKGLVSALSRVRGSVSQKTKAFRQDGRAPRVRLVLVVTAAFALSSGSGRPIVQAVSNPITVENALPGTLDSWDISGAGEPSIQGFATDTGHVSEIVFVVQDDIGI